MFSLKSVVGLALVCAGVASAATLTFDCNKIPGICTNDCYAIYQLSKPSTLHRDSAHATENRAETLCGGTNRCSGNAAGLTSCDEYPYASSAEGGFGAVTRCVTPHENSVQGGTLSSFYTRYSIKDGTAFSVAFANYSSIPNCPGNSVNSAGELTQRSHILANRAALPLERPAPRWFELEGGENVLVFENQAEDGQRKVWGQETFWLAGPEREVKAVREL